MVETPKPKGNGKGIDAALWRKVRIRALETDKTTADVMNEALERYFADKPSDEGPSELHPEPPPSAPGREGSPAPAANPQSSTPPARTR